MFVHVSNYQHTLVEGRQILDVLISNEVIDSKDEGQHQCTHKWDSNRLIPKFSRAKEGPFPYLFILVMEALSQILLRVREGGFISGFKARSFGRSKLVINFMSLKINMEKHELISIGVDSNMEMLAALLVCRVSSLI
ncbi:hypothetical protein CK203_053041 [Vitis vinifera]|uniref:Uncharacterized protein n=1 Tax=Vitis vinifera TaxID=29760 RepID=A0A438FL38_VITVI|nr:hypothetical protein CK203_053041 [Vitis vinifera]